jgi:hypothetical protein
LSGRGRDTGKDNPHAKLGHHDLWLVIHAVAKRDGRWVIDAAINWQAVVSPELEVVDSDNVILRGIVPNSNNTYSFYTLRLFRKVYLLGNVIFETRVYSGNPSEVVLQKVPKL